MNRKINIIDPEPFINSLGRLDCKNNPFAELNAEIFEILFEETNPIDGYKAPKNKETGKKFPNCCKRHKYIFEQTKQWFELFPNCCAFHKKIKGSHWFNKENYKDVAIKVVTQLSYTEYHLSKQINAPDWYKDITDYFDYNFSSFGQLPLGYGSPVGLEKYVNALQHFIKNTKQIPKEKKQKLIEYIELCQNPTRKNENEKNTDLNVLYSIYQKWLKTFPFELSYFKTLKEHFEKKLPFLTGSPEYNKYSKMTKYKAQTKSGLVEVLLNITNELITQMNGAILHEKGLLNNTDKLKLELVIESRKLKLNQGYKNNLPSAEQRYRAILKEWFRDEKKFINEISPLLTNIRPQPVKQEQTIQNEIPFETIIELNTKKYTDWVLNSKAVTRDYKKKTALSLMRGREKTINNYRNVIDEIFYKTTYWKEPTQQEKDDFDFWREDSFKDEVKFFDFTMEGNPLPLKEIKNKECKRVCDSINRAYSLVLSDMYNRWLPKDFYGLATLVGKIEYLKYLSKYEITEVKKITQGLTLEEVATQENLFCKGMPMAKVISHFRVLTEKKSKNESVFLTNEQLLSFIKKGFLKDQTLPKLKINFGSGEKGFVIKRFYEFFDFAVRQYAEVNRKDKYINLIINNFDNLGKRKTIESLFKSNKTKEKW